MARILNADNFPSSYVDMVPLDCIPNEFWVSFPPHWLDTDFTRKKIFRMWETCMSWWSNDDETERLIPLDEPPALQMVRGWEVARRGQLPQASIRQSFFKLTCLIAINLQSLTYAPSEENSGERAQVLFRLSELSPETVLVAFDPPSTNTEGILRARVPIGQPPPTYDDTEGGLTDS